MQPDEPVAARAGDFDTILPAAIIPSRRLRFAMGDRSRTYRSHISLAQYRKCAFVAAEPWARRRCPGALAHGVDQSSVTRVNSIVQLVSHDCSWSVENACSQRQVVADSIEQASGPHRVPGPAFVSTEEADLIEPTFQNRRADPQINLLPVGPRVRFSRGRMARASPPQQRRQQEMGGVRGLDEPSLADERLGERRGVRTRLAGRRVSGTQPARVRREGQSAGSRTESARWYFIRARSAIHEGLEHGTVLAGQNLLAVPNRTVSVPPNVLPYSNFGAELPFL